MAKDQESIRTKQLSAFAGFFRAPTYISSLLNELITLEQLLDKLSSNFCLIYQVLAQSINA